MTVVTATGTFGNLDWIVPRRPQHVPSLRFWQQGHVNDTILGQDRFYGAPGQSPNPNLPLPPKGRVYPQELRTYLVDQPLKNLIGQDLIIFGKVSYPLPPKGRPFPTDLRTYLYDQPLHNLIGQDALVTGKAPDFRNPTRPQISQPPSDFPNIQGTLLGQIQMPFGVSYWIVPWGKVYPIALRTYLQMDPGDPPTVRDLTLPPKGYVYPVFLRTWAQNPQFYLPDNDVLPPGMQYLIYVTVTM